MITSGLNFLSDLKDCNAFETTCLLSFVAAGDFCFFKDFFDFFGCFETFVTVRFLDSLNEEATASTSSL